MPSFRLPELPADEKYIAPSGGHVLHRLGHDAAVGGRDDRRRLAVLERRLHEVADVVHDDVAAGGAEARMFAANEVIDVNAVAKYNCAPGAMS